MLAGVYLNNQHVGGLRLQDFAVFDNGVPQTVLEVTTAANNPVDLTNLVDTSSSVSRVSLLCLLPLCVDVARGDLTIRKLRGSLARPRASTATDQQQQERAREHAYTLARPTTSALFFDPNPRQLQSAASICVRRAAFGMKSRSQSGS